MTATESQLISIFLLAQGFVMLFMGLAYFYMIGKQEEQPDEIWTAFSLVVLGVLNLVISSMVLL